MKKKHLILAVCSLMLIVLAGFSTRVIPLGTAEYYMDLPEGLDTISFAAEITLKTGYANHVLHLPSGGTQTSVYLFDSTASLGTDYEKSLRSGSFVHGTPAMIDLTGLSKGRYYIHYMSCNLGGFFPLTIK